MPNILCVAKYRSDVGYAWWLMELFWSRIGSYANEQQGQAFVLYPEVNSIPEVIENAPLVVKEGELFASGVRGIKQAVRILRELDISTLYLTDRPHATWRYILFRLCGIRNIILHDHTPGDRPAIGGVKGWAKAFRNRLPLLTVDAIFAVSPLMKQRAISNARFPARKCFVVQNGIPPVNVSRSREQVREELGLQPHDVVFVTTGRLHHYKRQNFIIRSFCELLTNTDRSAKLLIVGDGPQRQEFESLARSFDALKDIWFLGYRNDVPDILNASDVAIHAAKGEGFALAIVEYMASGLPVITPDIPSVCQAVDHEKNGLVYGDGDITALTLSLKILAENDTLRLELGQAARLESEQYTVDAMLAHFEAVWKRVNQ